MVSGMGSASPTGNITETVSGNFPTVVAAVLIPSVAAPTITDVDTDETILDGQTGVAVTGTSLGTTNANRTFALVQGSVAVDQVETGVGTDTAATLTIAVDAATGGDIKFGAATLKVTRDDDATGLLAVTVDPPAGQLFVDVGTPNTTASNRITAVPDIASGDQLQARGVGGGAAPTGLTLNDDATFSFAAGGTPTDFDVRVWDSSDSTWGAWATQTVGGGGTPTEIAAEVAQLTKTAFASSVNAAKSIQTLLASLTVSAKQASLGVANDISATTDTIALSPLVSSVLKGHTIAATTQSLSLTKFAATTSLDRDVAAALASVGVTKLSALVSLNRDILPTLVSLSITGNASTVSFQENIDATKATIALGEYLAVINNQEVVGIANLRRGTFTFLHRRTA
jgi:hypothetical protein